MEKLNVEDYVLFRDFNDNSAYPFTVYQIDKISKDGTKARGLKYSRSKDFPIEVQDYRKELLQYMDENHIENPILAVRKGDGHFGIWGSTLKEDDYDDIVHFFFRDKTREYKAACIGDIPSGVSLEGFATTIGGEVSLYYVKTPGEMADYIIKRFNLRRKTNLEERFHKWLESDGNENTDISAWKDYNGTYGQLEWAIDNNVWTIDYDEWQAAQRVLKHELKFETAMDITKVLYEKEDLNIFDIE